MIPLGKKDLRSLDTCRVQGCGKERREHTVEENNGLIHHEFSATGQLIAISNRPPKHERRNSQRSSGRLRPSVLGDPVLRFLLINKGIISVEELDEAERLLQATGALGPTPRHDLGRAAPNA